MARKSATTVATAAAEPEVKDEAPKTQLELEQEAGRERLKFYAEREAERAAVDEVVAAAQAKVEEVFTAPELKADEVKVEGKADVVPTSNDFIPGFNNTANLIGQ